ncbi:MAG: monooxygenase [Acidobacteriota bacterium]|nr:monooxygenase [Acidobacteriota bacterium]
MKNIGIVGCGIAGLHLGLFLQKHGIDATIYSDKTPDQIRAGRIPNFVVRFQNTLNRERALGVNHWDFEDFGVFGVHMYINVPPTPLYWFGAKKRPSSAVDMRIYQSTLLEDFATRGGKIVIGELQANDVARLSEQHDLMVVASGRGSLKEMFPRDAQRSPFTEPQRRITGAFFRGLDFTDPIGVVYNVSPGNGEIFQAPFTTFGQRVCSILIESIPGGAFDVISNMRYADDPKKFESTVLDLVRRHAPMIYERINLKEFGVLRPEDILQGAITPTVRQGFTSLGNGKFAMALGDVHVLVDPIIAQGANTASKCAWILGEALLEDQPLDEDFCRETEQRLWEAARAASEWTNATLQPPPPYALRIFAAAAQNQALANELIENFNMPERNWEIFSSPINAENFLKKHAFQTVAV